MIILLSEAVETPTNDKSSHSLKLYYSLGEHKVLLYYVICWALVRIPYLLDYLYFPQSLGNTWTFLFLTLQQSLVRHQLKRIALSGEIRIQNHKPTKSDWETIDHHFLSTSLFRQEESEALYCQTKQKTCFNPKISWCTQLKYFVL